MFRVDGPTAAPALPAPAAVSGTPGYFTGGDPSVPTPPTDVPVDWLNMIQEELVAIVAAAGISLSKADRGQVLAAIRALISSGGIAFASNQEAVAGAINNRALSPQSGAALVADRILGVIGGAPATLNTLGEIAASIGNDPAFAANVTAALAARVLTSRVISIPPALSLFAIIGTGAVFGLFGLFFSGGILVVAFTLTRSLYLREMLGENIPTTRERRLFTAKGTPRFPVNGRKEE